MCFIWLCILFIAFGGKRHLLNQLHCYMPCIYMHVEEKVLSVIHLFKSTQNCWIIDFRQILYKLNTCIIRSQYKFNDNFVAAMNYLFRKMEYDKCIDWPLFLFESSSQIKTVTVLHISMNLTHIYIYYT